MTLSSNAGAVLEAGEVLGTSRRALCVGGFSLVESVYPPGLALPEHAHAHLGLRLTVCGGFVERVGSRTTEHGADSVAIHQPAHPHAQRFGAQGARCFNVDLADPRAAELEDAGPFSSTDRARDGHLLITLRRLRQELRSPDACSRLAIEALGLELMVHLLRARRAPSAAERPRWVEEVRARLDLELQRPPSLSELARGIGVSPERLQRAFRHATGSSPASYVRRRRVERACELLRGTRLPLAEIASECGFCDQSHLTRTLRRAMGLTPVQVRGL